MTFGMPFLLETQSVEDSCRLCRELGLSFVELNANFPACQTDRLSADMLRQLKKTYQIDFTFHVEEECNPFAFQLGVREAWKASFCSALRLAMATDMPIVNMHLPHGVYITLPAGKVYLYEQHQAEYRAALTDFRQMCDRELEGTSVRIGIENTNGFQPHEQKAIEYLLESPVFGLTLDIGHLHSAGSIDLPFYKAHADRLIHMHGHDARGKKNHLALGDGEVDLMAYFTAAEQHYARIVLETKTVQALESSVSWLKTRL